MIFDDRRQFVEFSAQRRRLLVLSRIVNFFGEQCMTHKHEAIDPACTTYPLYESRWEHDACGIGFLAHVSGQPSHALVQTALEALARLTHRGAQDADAETSDGAGILTQIPRALLLEELAQQQ